MPLHTVKVMQEIAKGTCYVCAKCERFWETKAGRCASLVKCGSPLIGDHFNNYKGPIQEFWHWCIFTGGPSEFGLRIHGSGRVFGLSSLGLEYLRECVKNGDTDPTVLSVVSPNGIEHSLVGVKKEDPKTLSNLLRKIRYRGLGSLFILYRLMKKGI